ncbi:hypothetical protein ACFLYX_02090 [Chloroflexota bacterium]
MKLNTRDIFKFDYLMLLLVLGLSFYITFIPHQSYPYAIHVDEWKHMAYSQSMMQSGDITFNDPFFGEKTISFRNNLEAGFHLFWGVFQTISGIDWMIIFRYFPSIMFMITVLAVYILASREGFGWEAAFFTALIPTTVGILGPSFLVPVATGLIFTPLFLFLAFNFRTIWSYLAIFLFNCFLLAIHAPSAISPIIVLTPYILLNMRGNFKHSLGLLIALLAPFLAALPLISWLVIITARDIITTPVTPQEFVQLPHLIKTYGYLPTAACLLGTFILALKGGKKNYGLVLGLLLLLLMLVTFFTLNRGVPIMYERGLMYMILMLGIAAGYGLMWLKNMSLPEQVNLRLKVPLIITRNSGKFLCLVFLGATLAISIPAHLHTPYYQMIDKEDYQAFIWIKENVGDNFEKAIVDPWKGTAFTALTGKYVYTKIHEYPKADDDQAYDFIRGGSSNTTLLRTNDISIIYTRLYEGNQNQHIEYAINNPDLEEVAKNIYLLKAVKLTK